MSSDPYDISDAYRTTQPAEAIGVVSGLREDLRRVGSYQRWIIVSLLVQVTMLVAYGIAVLLLPPGPGPALNLTRLVTFTIGAIALVCGVLMAANLLETGFFVFPAMFILSYPFFHIMHFLLIFFFFLNISTLLAN